MGSCGLCATLQRVHLQINIIKNEESDQIDVKFLCMVKWKEIYHFHVNKFHPILHSLDNGSVKATMVCYLLNILNIIAFYGTLKLLMNATNNFTSFFAFMDVLLFQEEKKQKQVTNKDFDNI